MATEGRDGDRRIAQQHPSGDGRARLVAQPELQHASIPELLRRLSADGNNLMQQEIHLAKVEMRESASAVASGTGKIGVATVLALPGILALAAAAILGLKFLVGSYWLSSLIVGVVILVVAGVLLKSAVSSFKSGLLPKETAETVRNDVDWAKREVRQAKREMSA